MRGIKLKKNKKGYILIYVMLLGFLLVAMSLITMKFELEKRSVVVQQRIHTAAALGRDYSRQYLFSELVALLKQNKVQMTKDDIHNYLKDKCEALKITKEDMFIAYDKDTNLIKIQYPYDGVYNYMELYDIAIYNGQLNFRLLNKIKI